MIRRQSLPNSEIEAILDKLINSKRISQGECIKLFQVKDITLLGIAADEGCTRIQPDVQILV